MRSTRWGAFERDQGLCGAFQVFTEAALLFHVFGFLDVKHVLKLRGVCKSWYDAVLSPYFTCLYKPPSDPWAVLRVRTEEPLEKFDPPLYDDAHFDYNMELENHVELWRPYVGNKKVNCGLPLGPPGLHCLGLIASNGLVCGRIMQHRESLVLALGNPILNDWKVLAPAPIQARFMLPPAYLCIFMETDPITSSYQLIIYYDETLEETSDAEMCAVHCVYYESNAAAWEVGPALSHLHYSSGPPVKGFGAFQVRAHYHATVAYDPQSRVWSHMQVERPVFEALQIVGTPWENCLPARIGEFRYKGRWLWVSMVTTGVDADMEQLGLAIFEYQENSQKWRLVSRILGKELFGSSWPPLLEGEEDMKMQVVGDTVFISTFYRVDSFGFWPPATYNLELSEWYTCVNNEDFSADTGCLKYDIECSYVVVPSLTAKP